ncbi:MULTISPECIES: dermonecrotic toxin domain-containing protein [unclassified Pseudomonas]|uniref:dermonecrotic toxin domain-containing protein n=1 Tax=unclassified Pseudomonas TaxID=196821 RepID=UPI000C88D738|nr:MULTISPECIES: DUF6543 domain-containing protein [unclassified Pseudomonas]PMX28992.1 hypothetical protein C1Y23_03170 [Pseudomonas sp. GW460-12]PMX37772.1 hypothetical protein C1Y24_01405 [Pseudomonas sp. MPR-R2A4]PMX44100.1 hypothetical protein C1Y26_00450 [Pseudomonas sp. MPR-R2A7]PMX55472.1 hypothetical protein C1Y17_03315 [Pseudomonas sp. MPR-R2A6]PMX94206.1 hypothetical protein C1Y21_00450 [Pseudomonas sp. MPR-R2A3]
MSQLPSTAPHSPTDSLITQLCVGPAFREAAGVLLRRSLQELYPDLHIDPDVATVVTPVAELVDDEIVVGAPTQQHLTDILANQAVSGIPTLFTEGQHYLIQPKNTHSPRHLPVRIAQIAQLINVLAPVMKTAYQELQVDFWNSTNGTSGPHWQVLSNTLRSIWNVTAVEDWNAQECAMARNLFMSPEHKLRQAKDPYASRAYLIDVDRVDGETVKHLAMLSMAVLIGSHAGKPMILMYSLLNGYEKFTSLEQLGRSLPSHLPSPAPTNIQWRLFEPDGHFFDHQACALIAQQIAFIGQLDLGQLRRVDPTESSLNVPAAAEELAGDKHPDLARLRHLLPDWLKVASTSDLDLYARHLKDLAALHSLNAGKSFQDDIPPIQEYALTKLRAEMLKEHSDAANLRLDRVEIRVQSPVVWGSFTLPGKVDVTTFSLAELALQSLISLPVGNKSIHLDSDSNALPAWMTVAYVEALIRKVDIGQQYPALVKQKLLDNPLESARRQYLYSNHLRIQLPLLALQFKIRQENGIDELGYRYIVAVLNKEVSNRQVDGQTIVLRPLAFIPKHRDNATQDTVANMYVIGPQDPDTGPCLLYRPMLEPQLMQYPSPANLLYAIRQSQALRDSVLAWLPDGVRSDYARYAFPGELPSPWAAVELLVDPAKLLLMNGPMGLGHQTLNDHLAGQLYKANANALVTLADHQSVSNAEARWASFKQASWLAFTAVLPFLGRTVNAAAWIWQILDQLQEAVDADKKQDKAAEWSALTGLFLNLGMALTLHIASRNAPSGSALAVEEPVEQTQQTATAKPTVIKQLTDISSPALPSDHPHVLHTLGAINRTTTDLGKLLDSFKVEKPAVQNPASSRRGPQRYLYPLRSKWYAPVGQRWFEVTVDENDEVQIIDPQQPTRSGPFVIGNLKGEWFIDTRLRLRGGGSKSQERKARALAERQVNQMRNQLTTFEQRKQAAQEELQRALQAMLDAPAATAQAKRNVYLGLLDSQCANYETALQDLKTLNVFAPTPDFQFRAIGYIKAQLSLSQAGLTEILKTFAPKLKTTLEQIERQAKAPQERDIPQSNEMTEMLGRMIQCMDYFESRFTQLRDLSSEGLRLIQSTKSLLPSYRSDDLKALQVSLARNLCLREDTILSEPQAWLAIDQIVDACDIAIQALRDTLRERSDRRIDEQIETLSSLIEQFTLLDERLRDFPTEFPDISQAQALTRLRDQLSGYTKQTTTQLALLAASRSTLRSTPRPPSTPPLPQKKFIRTRYHGMVVGEPQLSATGQETGLVDVRSPLSNTVVATFHEKSDGFWVQRAKAVKTVNLPIDLQASVTTGNTLLTGLTAFKQRITELANQAQRTPIGIEYLYHQHAHRLEQASRDIEQALTQKNLAQGDVTLASSVKKSLAEATATLYQQSIENVLRMTKQHPPTPSGVQWLKDRNAISIKKTINRRRIKSATPDYLDEYSITDRSTHKVLWYAHFHYSTDWTTLRSFLSARLKTPQEQSLGATADTIRRLSSAQRVAFHRSEINESQAQTLFFNLT